MDNMSLLLFYKTLFILCLIIGMSLIVINFYEIIKAYYLKKRMYNTLLGIWNLATSQDTNNEEDVATIMRNECKTMYYHLVLNNKYLSQHFYSPIDLLKKFVTTLNGTGLENYKFQIISLDETKVEATLSNTDKHSFLKEALSTISSIATIIGVIFTLLSFFF